MRYEEEKQKNFLEVYKESAQNHPIMQIIFVIGVLMLSYNLINVVMKDINFYFSHKNPKVSNYTYEKINVNKEPIQTSTIKERFYQKGTDSSDFLIIPKANYSISAMIIAINANSLQTMNLLQSYDNKISGTIFPVEFGLAWGEVANPNHKKYLSYKFKKPAIPAKKFFYPKIKDNCPYSKDYVVSHISHVRIVSANDNLMSALMTLKKNDKVKIDGYLVDVGTASHECIVGKTDLSTTEKYEPDGYIYNKIIYANQVQIEDKIYR